MNKKVFSFDAETNGLWGTAFAIAAVVEMEDMSRVTFSARCPIVGETNEWVAENVLPAIEHLEITHDSYRSMLRAFSDFYMEHKKDADIIVHMGLPVESKVLLDMHTMGFIGDWDAPYPLIDISAIPEIGTSVDSYNKANNITVPFDGATHDPLYDSYAALVAYKRSNRDKLIVSSLKDVVGNY